MVLVRHKEADTRSPHGRAFLKEDRAASKPPREKPLKKQQANKVFLFLDLPAEIRNKIYNYALVDPESTISLDWKGKTTRRRFLKFGDALYDQLWSPTPKDISQLNSTNNTSKSWKWKLNLRLCPQLLRVCKQIKNEALAILYANNHIAFIDMYAMKVFLEQIGDHNIKYLRRLSLCHWDRKGSVAYQRPMFNKLIRAVSLEALILETGCLHSLGHGYPVLYDCSAQTFYDMAHGWLWTLANRADTTDIIRNRLFLDDGHGSQFAKRTQHLQEFREFPSRFGKPLVGDDYINWFMCSIESYMIGFVKEGD